MSNTIIARELAKKPLYDSFPDGYCARSGFFVDFEERYAIDGRLLGRKIGFRYGDCYLKIVIPSVIEKEGIHVLGVPGLFESFGTDVDDWGRVNNYQDLNKPETIRAWLSTVFVVCYAKEPQAVLSSSAFQKIAKKVVCALQTINPDAIRIPPDEEDNYLCKVKHAVSFNEEGRPQIEISVTLVMDDGKGSVTLRDIKSAIRNADKTITAPYEMLGNARTNLARNDLRAAVLNCATSLEVMLKRKVADHYDELQSQEVALKQADGFKKLMELCKKLKIPTSGLSDVQEAVMQIRHRVIHGGYVPSKEEARRAYSVTRAALREMNVPIFE